MASPKIEREVDEFVEQCPLRRHSITTHRRVVNTARHYDQLWKQALKEIEGIAEEESIARRRQRMVRAFTL